MSADTQNKLQSFFGKSITEKEFAFYMRKFVHASLMLNFEVEDNNYKKEVEEGYYWLTQLVETLDPVLQKQL